MNYCLTKQEDYQKRREADDYNEAYVQKILKQVYEFLGYKAEFNNDVNTQVLGKDVTLSKVRNNKKIVIVADEKCDTSRRLDANLHPKNDQCSTFALELSFYNKTGKKQMGWFHPSKRKSCVNDTYIFAWTNGEKDVEGRHGKFVKINQIEVCMVQKKALAKQIEQIEGFDYDEIQKMVDEGVVGKEKTKVVFPGFKSHPKVHIVYSGQLERERPVNCVVPKDFIRDLAQVGLAFNLTGENGNETITSVRRTHFDKQHPRSTWEKDFVPICSV